MNLIDLLPHYYAENKDMTKLQGLLSQEIEKTEESLENTINQCFVSSANDLLNRFEKLYGIETDIAKDIEIRRETIKSKMAGTGTFTKIMAKNSLKAFEGGAADIVEDFPKYKFTIKFNDEYRVPSNGAIAEIYNMINNLKPAHLNFDHTFTYNWWGMSDVGSWNDGGTWDDLRNYKEV